MFKSLRLACLSATVAFVSFALPNPVLAEDLVIRDVLQQEDLTDAEGMIVIVSKLTVKPGGRIPLHTHPGDEHAVIIQGGKAKMPNGKEMEFAAFTPMLFTAGDVHGGVTNVGDADIVIITTHVVRDNEPFQSPAE